MKLRPALSSDAGIIADVHVRSWQATYRGIVPDTYLDTLSVSKREAAFLEGLTRGSPEIWVADSQPGVAGWIAFGPSRDADASSAVGEVEAIYILPSHWSSGIGRNLWSIARSRLVERKFMSVTLWVLEDNQRAIRFYRAAGFAPDIASRKQISIGGKSLWEVRYAQSFTQ